jgi:hypothetical protein
MPSQEKEIDATNNNGQGNSFPVHIFLYSVPERKIENFFKFKEGANFNRRNTLSILRIALKLHCVPKFKPDAEIGKISSFRSGTI